MSANIYDRFTRRAKKTVVEAQEQARALKHNYVGTEHLLLALTVDQDSLAGKALAGLRVNRDEVHAAIVKIVGEGEEARSGQLPFTPRTKKVVELAPREALAAAHTYVGTEHLLLALVREGDGVAARILGDQGADPDRVRREVTRLLAGPLDRSSVTTLEQRIERIEEELAGLRSHFGAIATGGAGA